MSKLVRSNLLVSCFVYEWDGLVTISVQEAALLEHSSSQRNYGGCMSNRIWETVMATVTYKCIIMYLFSCILIAIVAQVLKSCTRLWIYMRVFFKFRRNKKKRAFWVDGTANQFLDWKISPRMSWRAHSLKRSYLPFIM